MLNEVIIKSPAKLNLHLKVYPKRTDGYHDIESIFQAIDFFDELHVAKSVTNGVCNVKTVSNKLPLENTLTVAYKEFCNFTGLKEGVDVQLTKRIFSGAGLGGGSSNGAALIEALDVLFKTDLRQGEKADIALKVGSDVPFFLVGGAAVVTGRGEFVRQIISRDDLYFVVIMPNIHSSTKDAFRYFDEQERKRETPQFIDLVTLEDVYLKPINDWSFDNSFTDLLVKQYACIGKALDCLNYHGAEFSQMSGSGAAVYGVFGNGEEAKRAYTKLSVEWTCVLARAYSIQS